ncbi:MAG TPA: NYN domain-containing protein [Candidatus Polarisedimenticolia bacterium]|nr:NYN domain-containing protein [Candidatus Polarisedimenticolia bacterium]
MEKLLIDGYNLLYKDGVLKNLAERSLEAAREELLESIAAYRKGDVEIVVVFDGQGASGRRPPSGRPGVQVRFSRPPKTADQVILEILEREARRSSLTVVTSDKKDIGRVARAEGVRWISSETFLRRLGRKGTRGARREPEKPPGSSPAEVESWLKRFGPDPDKER